MLGTFPSNYKYFSCQSSCLLLLLEVCKNHYKKENISAGGSEQRADTLKNSFKRDLAKYFWVTFGSSEFLNIHIFNWRKALLFVI